MMTVLKNPQGRVLAGVLAVLLLLATLLVSPWLWRTFRAEIIYVRPAATGAGNGTSWDNATTLRDALQNRARARDEVWIATGTHYPVIPNNPAAVTDEERDISFGVRSGVALYGGFAGTETERDQRDPATHATVLSGDLDQNDELDDGNSRTVVNLSGTDATTLLDGLTITAGGSSGIFNVGGSPTLINVRIVQNGGGFGSGAVHNVDNSNPTFTDVSISDNSGHGVWNVASSPTFTNVTISNNRRRGAFIGGVSNPTFVNTTIRDNDDEGVFIGGASSPAFTDVTIRSNGFSGVSIDDTDSFEDKSSPTFTNVIISDNRIHGVEVLYGSSATFMGVTISDNDGHGIRNIRSNAVSFTNGVIRGNRAGGVFNAGSNPTFTNVIISGNQAEQGGGVYNERSQATFTNVTISGNQAEQAGGGLFNERSALRVRNSIIWGNAAQNDLQVFTTGASAPEFESTLVQDIDLTDEDGGNLDGSTDPQFVAPVAPTDAPTSAGDYRLQSGSPLINGGVLRFLDETQDDVPDLNGDGDEDDTLSADQRVDLGALEFPTE